MTFTDQGGNCAKIDYGSFSVLLREDGFTVESDGDFALVYRFGKEDDHMPAVVSHGERELTLTYGGAEYGVRLSCGRFRSVVSARSEDGKLSVSVFRK